jgi:hypothetical protein
MWDPEGTSGQKGMWRNLNKVWASVKNSSAAILERTLLAVLEFELRASPLLGRCSSITAATPPALM